ncbi:MAG: rhomboid family intramembrane serine protease [Chloroflexi bacterium]|nr:rhomboid family intramembrane serine protease [Chloroflexota bacterium]
MDHPPEPAGAPDGSRLPDAKALADAVAAEGPLTRDVALALLDRGAAAVAAGEYPFAAAYYQRVVGFDDPAVTGAALLGLGEALYRMDREPDAVATWESILQLAENPSTYAAWRNVAAARVRSGDLTGAIAAYRQADRRAPVADKAEIASRLGWLSKETGDRGGSRRYFARSRGDGPALPLTWLVIGVTVIVSFIANSTGGGGILGTLELDKVAVANGEWYRLLSVVLVHAGVLHLFFNMYALWILGPLVEGIWGTRSFAVFYVLAALAGSTASFLTNPIPAVGASGAIFGLIGVVFAGTRAHHPVLDVRARSIVRQLGTLIVLNLVIGFIAADVIDNAAHIGGFVAGLWLGFVVPPGRAPTLSSLWQRPEGARDARPMPLVIAGVLLLVGVIALGLAGGPLTWGPV